MERTHIDLENNIDIDRFLADMPTMPRIARIQRPKTFQDMFQRYQSPIIGCVLFLTALGFNLYHLGTPSIWFDEAFSVELARQPLPLLWHIIFGSEPNMELYYLILHFWLQLTGAIGLIPTEFIVRLPSAIFAALSTLAIFAFGRRFLGLWVGIVGASLYLLNDLQLVYAQQTRAYSLQLLLLVLAYYALFAAFTCETRRKRWWLCYVTMTTLAIYTHLFSALILFSQVVAIAGLALLANPWRTQVRKQLLAFGASLLASGILSIPMILLSRQGSKTGWLSIPRPQDVATLFLNISANSKIYLVLIVAFWGLGLFAAWLSHRSPNSQLQSVLTISAPGKDGELLRQRLPVVFALCCWLFLPIILSYVISQGQTRLFSSRYLVTIVPPLCLLVGLGVAALRWRVVRVAIAVGIIALAARYTPLYYNTPSVEQWNTATSWLIQKYQPGDGMVCYTNVQGCQMSIEYYLSRYQSDIHFDADSPGADAWGSNGYSPINLQAGNEAAVDPTALAAYGAHHAHLFFIVARLSGADSVQKAQLAQQWLDSHYHFVGQIVTSGITIRLYATGTTQN